MNSTNTIRRSGLVTVMIALGLMLFQPLPSSARQFTSSDGKTLDGTIVKVTGESVILKIGGKNYTVPISRFVEADRTYIAEWKTKADQQKIPKLDIKINPGSNNRRDRDDGYDDRKGSFNFSIKLENRERGYDLKDAAGTLIVLGEDCDEDDSYAVMQLATMKFNAAEGMTADWTGAEVKFEFDDSEPSKWGYKYYSYIFILKNSSGTMIYKKTSQKKFGYVIDEALKLKHRDVVDRTLKKTGTTSTSYFK